MSSFSGSDFTILIVDDDPSFRRMLSLFFSEEEYKVTTADSGEDALRILGSGNISATVIDLKLPGMTGMDLLKIIRDKYPDILNIMITGQGNIRLAVEAVKSGAVDFIQKPFPHEELKLRIRKIYQMWNLKEENRSLKRQREFSFEPLKGASGEMQQLKDLIAQVGSSDVSILIQGETGTGKELVARALHCHSRRKNNPFVVVDCASLSNTVAESELFGHVKGSFTGAVNSATGLIRSADGGTVFLDEIGELDLHMQAKLLRVIQENEVRPVGSTKAFSVDVRFLAATNRNIKSMIEKGSFREDLYYRIQVITIEVPPLRNRKSDIPVLAGYFLGKNRRDTSSGMSIPDEVMELFSDYTWPGNVRELQNLIDGIFARGHTENIQADQVALYLNGARGRKGEDLSLKKCGMTLADSEKEVITKVLESTSGNRRKAAEILDIGEATLYRKLKKYGINNFD